MSRVHKHRVECQVLYAEGAKACKQGVGVADCPYPPANVNGVYWRRGWHAARSEQLKKEL